MDFETLTDDQFADLMGAAMASLHARINAKPDGPGKARAQRLASVVHGALEALRDHSADQGWVQQDSGGDPKPT